MLETPASLSFYGGNLALINLLGSKLSFLFCLFYFFFDNTGKEVVRCRRKAAWSQRKINSRCYGWCSITNQYIPIRGKSVFLSYSNKLKNNNKLQIKWISNRVMLKWRSSFDFSWRAGLVLRNAKALAFDRVSFDATFSSLFLETHPSFR